MVVDAARIAARSTKWPPGLRRDPRLIHRYLVERVRYRAEPPSRQVVRLPSATVKQRRGDCKSTAVFVVGTMAAAGRKVALRFIKQNGDGHYSHVYALVDGVPVDPLLPYGREAVSSAHLDVPIN